MRIKKIMQWKCIECGDIQESVSCATHEITYCKCGESYVDLEEHYCRFYGPVHIFLDRKDSFDEGRKVRHDVSTDFGKTILNSDLTYNDGSYVHVTSSGEASCLEMYSSTQEEVVSLIFDSEDLRAALKFLQEHINKRENAS